MVEPRQTAHALTGLLCRINVDERQLIQRASWVGKHHADNLPLLQCNFRGKETDGVDVHCFCGTPKGEKQNGRIPGHASRSRLHSLRG